MEMTPEQLIKEVQNIVKPVVDRVAELEKGKKEVKQLNAVPLNGNKLVLHASYEHQPPINQVEFLKDLEDVMKKHKVKKLKARLELDFRLE